MKIRLAINGFGRIGRQAFKIALTKPHLQVVALNNPGDPENFAYLLKYDTVYGRYQQEVKAQKVKNSQAGLIGYLTVARKRYPLYGLREPEKLPWRKLKVDIVLECTGAFVKDGAARAHLKAGAKAVIISAPAKGRGGVRTYVKGVNEHRIKDRDIIISNASCTTNCISPVMRVMNESFGVAKAMMTTIHGYTADQRLVDGAHKDFRRGRAAARNIVPTTTGAAIATTETIPDLKNLFDGIAIRVPVVDGSLSDFTFLLKQKVTVKQINSAFRKAAISREYKEVLTVTEEPLVSSDIIGLTYSAIVDLSMTRVVAGDLVKVLAWYDNEWGYANRLVEMIDVVMGRR